MEQQPKKVKMTFDYYKKYAFMIINIMKEFENHGEENVRQQDRVDRMVQEIEVVSNERHTSIEKGIQTSKMVANIIQYLITNEKCSWFPRTRRSDQKDTSLCATV